MKDVFKNNKILMIISIVLPIAIGLGFIFLFKEYKDMDYLIVDSKGELIGFSEYNMTKKKLVKYNKDGKRLKDTYSKGDNLVVLVQKEHKDIVVIPKEVKSIKKDLFIGISYINTLKIDMDIKNIDDEMFMNSTFKKIILPSSVKSIGKQAFMNNVYLKSVEGNIVNIKDSAFENCVSLKSIDLKKSKNIGENAFKGCNSIKKLYISKNIKSIGKDAFMYLGNRSVIYTENFKSKLMIDGKYTKGKTTVVIDKKYFE